jgi:hypothetical protein
MEIIRYAKMAAELWNNLPQENKVSLRRHFHLRPTNSGITIVSTLPFFPMRGLKNIKNENKLSNKLNEIHDNIKKICSIDGKTAINILEKVGFKNRENTKDKSIEEDIQALMIRSMSKDENLRIKLKANNKIQFIASELIFEKGKNRVDIVGFDGIDLFLFELKKGRTTKVDQVKRYVDYYSESKNLAILQELLKNYPINPVEKFQTIKGVMVMQYAENSDKNMWNKLAADNSINILFFEKSLSYR